jgi:hypothetical protein
MMMAVHSSHITTRGSHPADQDCKFAQLQQSSETWAIQRILSGLKALADCSHKIPEGGACMHNFLNGRATEAAKKQQQCTNSMYHQPSCIT